MRRASTSPEPIPGLIDSHCHLDYPPMLDDLAGTLERAAASGVEQVIHIGCDLDRIDPALRLAEADPRVFSTIGIHPHEASSADEQALGRVVAACRHPRVVAVGETGLDFHYDRSPRPAQREAFARQISIARELDLPLVLHIRDAHADAWSVLQSISPRDSNPGVVHCFTGEVDEARRWLDLGFHISFSGIATFKTAGSIRDAAKLCPPDRILLETDAPFLAPEPVRGRKNEPALLAYTCAAMASVRSEAPSALAAHTTRNTRALFSLPTA